MKTEPSPITGKPMSLIAEPEKVAFRGEDYAYMHFCYLCADSGEKFTTMELDGLRALLAIRCQRRWRTTKAFLYEINLFLDAGASILTDLE